MEIVLIRSVRNDLSKVATWETLTTESLASPLARFVGTLCLGSLEMKIGRQNCNENRLDTNFVEIIALNDE